MNMKIKQVQRQHRYIGKELKRKDDMEKGEKTNNV